MKLRSLLLALTATVLTSCHSEPTQVPSLGILVPFTLTDASGNPFSTTALNGKFWVLNFFFTRCPGPCPEKHRRLASLANTFPELHIVSVTVDPENDTPETLAAYAKNLEAPPDRWHFLTGKIEEIDRIAMESARLDIGDEPAAHTVRLVLVDGNGVIRGYYVGIGDEGVRTLAKDLKSILKSGQ